MYIQLFWNKDGTLLMKKDTGRVSSDGVSSDTEKFLRDRGQRLSLSCFPFYDISQD
jgi:hypothetical protein